MLAQRLAALQELIEHPAKNPNAAAMGIGILVIALLMLATVLLALALPKGRTAPGGGLLSGRRRSSGPSARASRLGGLIAAVVALVAIGSAYALTSSDSYCGATCHAMAAPREAWRASSHAGTACVRCHEGPVILSAPSAVLLRTASLVAQASGRTASGRSAVPARRCLGCHPSLMTRVVVSKRGVAMAHEHVIDAGASCGDCHGSQGHEKPGRIPAMSACLPCHDGDTAPSACATCHRTSPDSLIGTEGERFGEVQLTDRPTCGGCHSEAACDDCHGLRMPHPDGFADPSRHAGLAAFARKDRVCYRCHTFADCSECHKPFNAHVKGWESEHAKYPRDTGWCRGCHDTSDMCALCHKD